MRKRLLSGLLVMLLLVEVWAPHVYATETQPLQGEKTVMTSPDPSETVSPTMIPDIDETASPEIEATESPEESAVPEVTITPSATVEPEETIEPNATDNPESLEIPSESPTTAPFVTPSKYKEIEIEDLTKSSGIRNTPPDLNSQYYSSSNGYGGYSMPNCTAYVYGRLYEMLGYKPNISFNNANTIYSYNANNNIYSYSDDAYSPAIGAIACYTNSGGGHVQIVEEIGEDSGGKYICVSESNYSGRESGKEYKAFNYIKIYLANLNASKSSGWVAATYLQDNDGYNDEAIERNGCYMYFQGYVYAVNGPTGGEELVQFWGIDNGTVISDNIKIWAKRSDTDTNHYAVFYIDGKAVTEYLSADESGFFAFELDISSYSEGTHTIEIYYANSYGSSRDTITINIKKKVDVTAPIITNARIENISPNGYDVICTATDNVGVEKVTFVTWWNGTYNQIWEDGTKNGDTYSYHVDISKHNYQRNVMYFTDIRAYDSEGNGSLPTSLTATVPSNESTIRFDASGGTIETDTVTMTYGSGNYWDVSWMQPTNEGYHFKGWYTASGHQVYDANGFCVNDGIYWSNNSYLKYEDLTLYAHWEDVTNPIILDAKIENITPDGYDVICTATDNVGVEKVTFVTWWNGTYNQIWEDGTKNGDTYSYHVDISKHNYQRNVMYFTDIRAYDSEGNGSLPTSLTATVPSNESTIRFDASGGTIVTDTVTMTYGSGNYRDVSWLQPTNEGYYFKGWYTASGDQIYDANGFCVNDDIYWSNNSYLKYEDLTLYAQWTTSLDLIKNEQCILSSTCLPTTVVGDRTIIWTSSAPLIVSVDANGRVTAKAFGTATITAQLKSNLNIKATYKITVSGYRVTFDTKGGTTVADIVCGKDDSLNSSEEPTKDGYSFTGWYKDTECTIPWDMANDVVNGNITLYAGWLEYHEGLWIVDIPAQQYTGSPIKPKIEVYHHAQKLTEGKDYIVSYKNNTQASTGQPVTKQPTVVVTGIGNYRGKETATFTILQKDLADASISADDVFVSFNGKSQKPKLVVKDGKKTLKVGRDYYIQNETSYVGVGSYSLILVGKGNYVGSREVDFTISSHILISKASVTKIPNQVFTGKEIKPMLTIKHGGRLLVENSDYTVLYINNVDAGTATAVISGINSYCGQKKVTFQIEGTPINKVYIHGITDLVYNGKIQTQDELSIYSSTGEELKEGIDYSVSYKNNKNAGTATMIFTGMNSYSGTVKKTFKIAKYDIGSNSEGWMEMDESNLTVAYEKGGSKPDITIRFNGKLLKNGQDYTLSYKKNQSVTGDNPSAEIIIAGKGNFTGKITKYFQIDKSNLEENVSLMVADKAFSNKKGGYRSEPVLTDKNGKKLSRGKDYFKDIKYYLVNADGTETVLLKDSVLDVGSTIKVYIEGCGNYEGTLSATYVITPTSFNKTKVIIDTQEYTGKAVTLEKSDITIKYNGTVLEDDEYDIVSYSNNVKAGTAKVVLKGNGNYGGMKTVNFKIDKKAFLWWRK